MANNEWLTSKGSLTVLMEEKNQGPMIVSIKQSRYAPLTLLEQNWLNVGSRRWAFLREVELRSKPLGPLLFKQLKGRRIWMELERKPCLELPEFSQDFLWHRRSLFELAEGLLMVTEIFLPDNPVYEYKNKAQTNQD